MQSNTTQLLLLLQQYLCFCIFFHQTPVRILPFRLLQLQYIDQQFCQLVLIRPPFSRHTDVSGNILSLLIILEHCCFSAVPCCIAKFQASLAILGTSFVFASFTRHHNMPLSLCLPSSGQNYRLKVTDQCMCYVFSHFPILSKL